MKHIQDTMGLKGIVHLRLIGADGKTKTERKINNLVVQSGKDFIAAVFHGTAAGTVRYMGVGSNTPVTPPGLTQTNLVEPLPPRVSCTDVLAASPATITYEATFAPGVSTGDVAEAALFTTMTDGTMVARTTFPSIPKGPDDIIVCTWTLIFG